MMMIRARYAAVGTALAAGLTAMYTLPPQEVGNWFFYTWTALSTLLVGLYVLRAPSRYTWRRTDVGRALMYQTGCMAILGIQGSIALTWPSYPLRVDVRQALFLLLILVSLNMLLAVTRIQADMRAAMVREKLVQKWQTTANPVQPEKDA